jgi:hypothetical protein
MQSQFVVTPYQQPTPPKPADPNAGVADLLRELLDVQREQLQQLRASAQAHDASARWRALLGRWRQEYPGLPDACREALPILEKAYGAILNQLVEELRDNGPDAFESEFALQDFLDRYGMRVGQMGNLLNLVGPLAEAAGQGDAS